MDAVSSGGTNPKAPLAPRMDILRFATAGSVDDGKSTLIGRLLYDSKSIFADQLEAVERTSRDAKAANSSRIFSKTSAE